MMFSFKNEKACLVRHRVDFRKGHNGLIATDLTWNKWLP
jgi:hypothetical protein